MTFELYARQKLPYAQKQPLLRSSQPAAGQMGAGAGSGASELAPPGEVVAGRNDGEIPVDQLSNAVEQSVEGGGWKAQKEQKEKEKKARKKRLCCS